MSKLSEWASRFKPNQELYCLESKDNTTGLFMMKEKTGDGIPCYSYLSPVYYVWINDCMVRTGMDYRTMYEVYEKELESYENDR